MNIFVLIKTSSEDEDERRLHQDECLLRCFFISWLMLSQSATVNNSANPFIGMREIRKSEDLAIISIQMAAKV